MSETVYGLVDYGSESDLSPVLIVGKTREGVDREAYWTIRDYYGSRLLRSDVKRFLAECPYPLDSKDPRAVSRWLEEHWEFTTAPSYSTLEESVIELTDEDDE